MLVLIIKKLEYIKQAMHYVIAHHPSAYTQSVPKQWSPSPSQLPKLIYSELHHIVWNIPLISLGQLSWPCPLPASCALAASSLKSP